MAKTKVILIPSGKSFEDAEKSGIRLTYDMLQYNVMWKDGEKATPKFANSFRNMLIAMLDLKNVMILLTIDVDSKNEMFIIDTVFVSLIVDGRIIFPKKYNINEDENENEMTGANKWNIFTGTNEKQLSKKEWQDVIKDVINNN